MAEVRHRCGLMFEDAANELRDVSLGVSRMLQDLHASPSAYDEGTRVALLVLSRALCDAVEWLDAARELGEDDAGR